jgi:hypothetical protein
MIARCNSAVYPIPTQATITENVFENMGSLAAGLPHFATGIICYYIIIIIILFIIIILLYYYIIC